MLKLQFFGHLIQRANSLGKILMLGKIEVRKRRGKKELFKKMTTRNFLVFL